MGIPSPCLLWSLSLCPPLVLWAHAWVFRKSTQIQAGISAATHRQEQQGEGQAEPRAWNQQGLMWSKGAVLNIARRTWVLPGPMLLWSEAPAILWLGLSLTPGTLESVEPSLYPRWALCWLIVRSPPCPRAPAPPSLSPPAFSQILWRPCLAWHPFVFSPVQSCLQSHLWGSGSPKITDNDWWTPLVLSSD